MNQINKRLTIKQVAVASGVSTQTVSRVINNRPDVARETRERVLKIIKKMGFQPSALARSLIQQRSYTLGVVTAGLKYIGPSRILNGITNAAEEAGYSLILKELSNFNDKNIVPIFNTLLSRHVDGIIWATPEIGANREWVDRFNSELQIPIVYLTMGKREGLTIISVDNYKGAEIATNHLIEKGYKNIGHISGPLDWWEARQRFGGWKNVVNNVAKQDVDQQFIEGNWSSFSGMEACKKLFKQYPKMDAIFAANDQMALGALAVIHQLKLKVPKEFGIIGFDNIAESEFFWPSLSTIQHDQHMVGNLAVKEIIKIIETIRNNETPGFYTKIIEPEIIKRNSTNR